MSKKNLVIVVLILAIVFILYPKTYELPGGSIFGSWDGDSCAGYSYDFGYQRVPDGADYRKCVGIVYSN